MSTADVMRPLVRETPVRRASHKQVTARRILRIDTSTAADYFKRVDTNRAAYIIELAHASQTRLISDRCTVSYDAPPNPDAGSILPTKALVVEVITEFQKAISAGDMFLYLTSTCCPTDACERIDFKYSVVKELAERFSATPLQNDSQRRI